MPTLKEQQGTYRRQSDEMWEQCNAHIKDPFKALKAHERCMRGYGYEYRDVMWGGDYVRLILSNDGTPLFGSFKAWYMKGEEELNTHVKITFGNTYAAHITWVANSDVDFEFVNV